VAAAGIAAGAGGATNVTVATASPEAPRLRGRPERIFVSVDESTGRSTLSFAPPDAGDPVLYEGDHAGERAMKDAQTLAARYPGATVHGPHFHAARPARARVRPRKPAP
jgi:hypothetical protein